MKAKSANGERPFAIRVVEQCSAILKNTKVPALNNVNNVNNACMYIHVYCYVFACGNFYPLTAGVNGMSDWDNVLKENEVKI